MRRILPSDFLPRHLATSCLFMHGACKVLQVIFDRVAYTQTEDTGHKSQAVQKEDLEQKTTSVQTETKMVNRETQTEVKKIIPNASSSQGTKILCEQCSYSRSISKLTVAVCIAIYLVIDGYGWL